MFSFIVLEAALCVAAILGVASNYPRRIDEAGAAGIVMIVALTVIAFAVVFLGKRRLSRAQRNQES